LHQFVSCDVFHLQWYWWWVVVNGCGGGGGGGGSGGSGGAAAAGGVGVGCGLLKSEVVRTKASCTEGIFEGPGMQYSVCLMAIYQNKGLLKNLLAKVSTDIDKI
jgi:hypothetical protein